MSDHEYQLSLLGSGCTLKELVDSSLTAIRFYLDMSDGKYELCFSGGKDSVVVKRLLNMTGVPYEPHYRVTTIDPPPLIRFIRRHHPEVIWDRPERPFFAVMPERGIPTRQTRWCCQMFKEVAPRIPGRVQVAGIRAAESPRRAKDWTMYSTHIRTSTRLQWRSAPMLNPILHWPDDAVWEFIRTEGIPYCELYRQGFNRLGCVGCPMSNVKVRKREFALWPRYRRLWRKAFQKLWDRRAGSKQTRGPRKGMEWWFSARFKTADEGFAWWESGDRLARRDETCMGMW